MKNDTTDDLDTLAEELGTALQEAVEEALLLAQQEVTSCEVWRKRSKSR